MSDAWVMTESDKVEKKNAAEVRKKLKLQATAAHDRNQVDLASVPLSSYLQKRAQFKQEIRRTKSHPHPEYQQQNSRTRTNSGGSSVGPVPSSPTSDGHDHIDIDHEDSVSVSSMSTMVSPSQSDSIHSPLTPAHINSQFNPSNLHFSDEVAADLSLMNARAAAEEGLKTEDIERTRATPFQLQIPARSKSREIEAWYPGGQESPPESSADSVFPVDLMPAEMAAPFSKDDRALVSTFVRLEEKSRDAVPMSDNVIVAIQESVVHGKPLKYAAQMEGYFIAVQRLAHYIVKVDAFNMFTMEDRRALIGNNCHLAVNIKSARLLNPGNSLQQQIQLAAGSETIVRSSQNAPRIEYEHIFTSPWCCDESEESQYRTMMESLTSLNMDDGECTLFLLAAMFDTSDFETHGKELTREQYTVGLHYFDVMMGLKDESAQPLSPSLAEQKLQITRKAVEEKELALSIQKFYMRLLQRYLSAKHGQAESTGIMNKYHQALGQLREMRAIILEKSLQF